MAVTVDITNHTTRKNIYKQFIADVIGATLAQTIPSMITQKDVLVTGAVVTPCEIKKANKKLCGMDNSTDILSCGEYGSIEAVQYSQKDSVVLGELILCYDVIETSAKIDSVHFLHELSFVVAHGALHLLGYEHCDEMFAIQDTISKKMMNDYAIYS